MFKKIFFGLIVIFSSNLVFSQIGSNILQTNVNTLLHVSEKNNEEVKMFKGVIYPKYTTEERNSNFVGLTEKENGLIIYNKTEGCFNYWRQDINYPVGKWAIYGNCSRL